MTKTGIDTVLINNDILSLISGRRNAFFNVLKNKLGISYRTISSFPGTKKEKTEQIEIKGKKGDVTILLTVLKTLKKSAISNTTKITLDSLRREVENIQISQTQRQKQSKSISSNEIDSSAVDINEIVVEEPSGLQKATCTIECIKGMDQNDSVKCSKKGTETGHVNNEQGNIPRRKRGRPPKNALSKHYQAPLCPVSKRIKGEKNVNLVTLGTLEFSPNYSDGSGTSVKDGTTIVKRSSGETVSFTKLELSDASPERKKELLRHLKCAPNVRLGRKRKSVIPMPPQKMFIYTPLETETETNNSPGTNKNVKEKMKYNIYELDIDFKTAQSISEMDQMELSQFIALSCTKRIAQEDENCENESELTSIGHKSDSLDEHKQSNDKIAVVPEIRKETINSETKLTEVEPALNTENLSIEKSIALTQDKEELSAGERNKQNLENDIVTALDQNPPMTIDSETKSVLNQLGLIRKEHGEFPGDNEESISESEEVEEANLSDDGRESESYKGFAADDDFVDIMNTAMSVSSVQLKKIQNQIEAEISKIEQGGLGRATFSYPCPQAGCNFEAKARCTLCYHMRRKHMPRLFICPLCNFEFGMRKDLWKHIHTHNERHTCGICGSQYRSPTTLRLHLKRHEEGYNPQPYHCEKCNKKFTHKHSLQSHCSIVHDGTGKRFHCKYCNRSFSQKNHMLEHENIHSDNRPHKCGICEKTFHHMSSLRHHMDIHDPVKKFKCSECGKNFKQRNSLHMHMVTHSGPCYQCDVCPKMFTQKQALLRHKRIHTGDRPFMCKLCKRKFSDQSILRRHLIGVHKVQKRDTRKEMCVQESPLSVLEEVGCEDKASLKNDPKTVYVVVQKETPVNENSETPTFKSQKQSLSLQKEEIKREKILTSDQTNSVPAEPNQSTEEISTDEATEPDMEYNAVKVEPSPVVLNHKLNQPEELTVSSETRVITPKGLILYECLLCNMKYTNEEALLYHAKQVHKTLARNAVQPKTKYTNSQRQQGTKQILQNKSVGSSDIETMQILLPPTSSHINKAPVLHKLVTQKAVTPQPTISVPEIHVINEQAIIRNTESTTFSTTNTANVPIDLHSNGSGVSILRMPTSTNPPTNMQESTIVDMSLLKMPMEGLVRIMDQNLASSDVSQINHLDFRTKHVSNLPQVIQEITVADPHQLDGEHQVQIVTSDATANEVDQNVAECFSQVSEANLIDKGTTELETENQGIEQEQYHSVQYLVENNSLSETQAFVAELNDDGTIIFPENFVLKDTMVYITTDVNSQNDTSS